MLGEPTRIAGLDAVTDGLSPLGLTLVVGPPGSGKTTLAMQIASHAARDDRDVLYLSLFSESHEKLLAHLRSFSFFDESQVGRGIELLSLKSMLEEDGDAMAGNILRTARSKRRPLLVLDGFRGLPAVLGEQAAQRLLATIASQLPYLGASCLLTAEFGIDAPHYTEMTIADGIIMLSRLHHGGGRYRMLEVMKLRGHAFREGPHGMAITGDGIVVYPRLATILPPEEVGYASGRNRFDLPELDGMVGGGLPTRSATVISGEPGTGKTTLALQYLAAGAAVGEAGLLVTFGEPVSEIIRKATDLGIDLISALDAGTVRIRRLPPIELHPDELAWRIVDEVQRFAITRLVIDGVEELERAASVLRGESDYLAALLEFLRRMGTTTVMLRDRRGSRAAGPASMPITQNRLLLRRVQHGAHWYRVISVLSMQGSDHDTGIRAFRVGQGGIRLLDPTEVDPDALAGIAGGQSARDR